MVCWAAGHAGWAAASCTARYPADRRRSRSIARIRERTRTKRVLRAAIVLGIIVGYTAYRYITGNPFGAWSLPKDAVFWLPPMLLIPALGGVMVVPMLMNSRSPAVLIRPDQID